MVNVSPTDGANARYCESVNIACEVTAQDNMTTNRRIVVLLSTYNGERFIEQQLQSILAQLPEDGMVMVRDDGSTDSTASLIDAVADPRVSITKGPNLGFGRSFLTLLAEAPADAEMIMFADQDDVWFAGKIDRAWEHLQQVGIVPALYSSSQMLADLHLRPLQATPAWPQPPSYKNALIENIVTGCTAALNGPAAELVRRGGVPASVRFHDWWMYLIVSAFGTVMFDPVPTLLYRQHGSNSIGHGTGWWGRQTQILRFLSSNDWVGIMLSQARAFHEIYGSSLAGDRFRLLHRCFAFDTDGVRPSWRLVVQCRRQRQFWFGEISLRMLVAAYLLGLWPLRKNRIAT
jgi:glycosyltransferase involved in cell wall biosynthesis